MATAPTPLSEGKHCAKAEAEGEGEERKERERKHSRMFVASMLHTGLSVCLS